MRLFLILLMISSHFAISVYANLAIPKINKGIHLKELKSIDSDYFDALSDLPIPLMAQPMVKPRPVKTETMIIRVRAVHDEKNVLFRLNWDDPEVSEAGKLGEFSDAVAVQFPVRTGDNPPSVFMGAKDDPVLIYHWRAQYMHDKKNGKKDIKDIYPNMNIDMYPMEFKDMGSVSGIGEKHQRVYSHGRAAANPQSFTKSNGIDEILAEGFGSSAVQENIESHAEARWQNGQWFVYVMRPLKAKNGSALKVGDPAYLSFAVWQGGKDEVGSRKSVAMSWTAIELK